MKILSKISVPIFLFLISIIFLLILPSYEFPMNDEWIYVRSAQIFANSNRLVCEGCTTSGLLLVLIGGLIIKLFGLNFFVLRFFIITLSSLAVLVTYLLSKKITNNRELSVIVALLLLANPIYYNLSHLFITDIPFLTLSLISIYFGYLGIEKKQLNYFFISALFSSANIFFRQNAFLIPLGIFFFFLLYQKKSIFNVKILLSLILPFLFLALYFFVQFNEKGTFYSQEFDYKNPIGISIESIYHTWSSLIYFGFFFLPLSYLGMKSIRNKFYLLIFIFFAFTALSLYFFASQKLPQTSSMPYLTNILNKNSIGAMSIPGQAGKSNYFPNFLWAVLTILSIFSTSFLAHKGLSYFFSRKFPTDKFFIIVTLLLLSFVLFKLGAFFDKNLVVFIPLLSFIFIKEISGKKFLIFLSIITIIFFFLLSILGNYDYVSWNKVRWDIINNLLDKGVSKEKINGGFEFCLFNYGMKFSYEYWKTIGFFDFTGYRPHDWEFCPGDDYVISFSENPNDLITDKKYLTDKTYEYCIPFNLLCNKLFLLKSV